MGCALDDGPNCTHNIFYNYLSSLKQKVTMLYVWSSVVYWLLEVSAPLRTAVKICARECFSLSGTCSMEVDFFWWCDRHLVAPL